MGCTTAVPLLETVNGLELLWTQDTLAPFNLLVRCLVEINGLSRLLYSLQLTVCRSPFSSHQHLAVNVRARYSSCFHSTHHLCAALDSRLNEEAYDTRQTESTSRTIGQLQFACVYVSLSLPPLCELTVQQISLKFLIVGGYFFFVRISSRYFASFIQSDSHSHSQ